MVEQALYFAIGFLTACLIAVVGIPAIARRATRLSEARARLRAPATEKQANAERDALRAQNAVERVRLERRLALIEDASYQLRGDVGRQSVKILALESAAAEQIGVIADQNAEIAEREAERRDLEAGLGASQIALNDAFAQRDRANNSEAAATARQIELEAEASRDRARIAILTARSENIEGRFEDLTRSAKAAAEKAEATRVQLMDTIADQLTQVRRLESQLRDALLQNQQLSEKASSVGAEREQSRRRHSELESRLAHSEQAREEALIENSRQLAMLAEREAQLRNARAGDDAGRGKGESQKDGIAAPGASGADNLDDAALREAIERLGREVTRLFAERKSTDRREEHGSGLRSRFGRRDAGGLAGPSNDEPRGFVDGSGRRVARTLAPDR